MAQNLLVNGIVYNGVTAIEMTNDRGEKVQYTEGGSGGEPDNRELYQRVEYIESAEEETYPYIITDFFADNDSGMEVIASFPVMQDRIPMGSRQDSGTTRFYVVYPLIITILL